MNHLLMLNQMSYLNENKRTTLLRILKKYYHLQSSMLTRSMLFTYSRYMTKLKFEFLPPRAVTAAFGQGPFILTKLFIPNFVNISAANRRI